MNPRSSIHLGLLVLVASCTCEPRLIADAGQTEANPFVAAGPPSKEGGDVDAGPSETRDAGTLDLLNSGVPDAGTLATVDAGSDAGELWCADGGQGCVPNTLRAFGTGACILRQDGRLWCWGLALESCCSAPHFRSESPAEVPLPFPPSAAVALEGGG